MSDKIKIFDTTLRDGEQSPGCSMNLREKIEMAKQLERLGVDIIEAGFAMASPGDLESVQTVAREIKNATVASLARCVKSDIDAAWEGVRKAQSPRIHVFLATSPIHMKYKLEMEPDAVIERAAAMVKYARSYCPDIEFSCEDATRSEPEFLVRVLDAVIRAGATTLNLPDTVGYTTPYEIEELMRYISRNTPGIEKAILSTHCHNDLGLGVINSLAAIRGGARQVECTINGIGERAGNAALEEIVMAVKTRKDIFGVDFNIDTTALYRTSRLLQSIIGVPISPTKAVVGDNVFRHESGIHQHGVLANSQTYEIMTPESVGAPKENMVFGKHSGRHGFESRLQSLGYQLEKEEIDRLFEKIKVIADKKKTITDRDIEALVSNNGAAIHAHIALDHFVINSGSTMSSTAKVGILAGEEKKEYVALGDGPIDAAFNAINQAMGMPFELEDYSIRAITQGGDALGEATVKLRAGEDVVAGRGVSTDIIESSIKAYINGVNKLLEISPACSRDC